jgi:magnesium transporter
MSAVANRTNEIMKFHTLFTSTLFPLTVITGLYGMNFEHMPELRSRWGYPLVLGAMAVVTGAMLLYFRFRGWLGAASRDAIDADGADRAEAGDDGKPPRAP